MMLNATFTNDSGLNESAVCSFPISSSFVEVQNLIRNSSCYKHSSFLTIFLFCFNLFVLLFGWFGNFLVIYVVCCKLKKKSTSSLFILNLAVADSLLLLFCIPPTLLVNIFTPWILGELMCKGVTYAQGVSVFVSVYSLVAISSDRCQAVQTRLEVTKFASHRPLLVILLIWLFGLLVPLPWMFVFQLVDLNRENDSPPFPFCQEAWPTKGYEHGYFFICNMLISYLIPLVMITLLNVIIWRSFAQSKATSSLASTRKHKFFKVFTFLTFAFFLSWFPLYIIMTRVKVFSPEPSQGNDWENTFMSVAVPVAQLLGPVNSCLNPVLYASLNSTYGDCLRSLCCCTSSYQESNKSENPISPNQTRVNCNDGAIGNQIKESYV